ncbi:hypothetical protein [Acinetobacter nectaris]|uniref:hypothetical protein n=1 Tax=Acinetobacter nectaris TaxID=1219382 RepID=UPI001F1A3BB3|nr:hypothetical protein [Acinetobacter nectaris]MCF9035103.1 hypothetical protein [Acinetobacter nectaris]
MKLALGSTATFADDLIDYDGKLEQKVIYPVNGKSGFVFNKLSQVFKTSSQRYNTINAAIRTYATYHVYK